MAQPGVHGIRLVTCLDTSIVFDDATFEVTLGDDQVTVALDSTNFATISQKSQEVAWESRVDREVALSIHKTGDIDYLPYFFVAWEDDESLPELTFKKPPVDVIRRYAAGQSIELGLEDVAAYRVVYKDGVEGTFKRTDPHGFEFSFSTGFYGWAREDPDGSYTLHFKGDRLNPAEDALRSQSKFIVSRSKYSGNLLLLLQDEATVHLR
jgi:hypothetical protein